MFENQLTHDYRVTSSFLSPALWAIFEILHEPGVHKHLTSEISKHYSPQSGEYHIDSIAKIPLLQSVQNEVMRLRVATVLIRTNEAQDFQLDAQWKLSKGDTVLVFTHDLSLNQNLWANRRPQSVERPLEEFWAERFLGSKRHNKVENGQFGLEGLELLRGDFDTDILGKDCAEAIQTATLAVFLTQFDLQLCDPEAFAAAIPAVCEQAYGTVKPSEWITVRIRKRKMGEK